MAELLFRIGRFAARRRLAVIATWLMILATAGSAFAAFGAKPTGELSIPGTATAQVTDHLAASMPGMAGGSGTVVFSTIDGSPFSDAQQSAIAELVARAARIEGVSNVVDPFVAQAEREAKAIKLADGRQGIAQAKADLAANQQQLDAVRAKLVDGQGQLDAARAKLVDGQAKLDAGMAEAEANQDRIDAGLAKIRAGQAKLDAARRKLADGQARIDAARAELAANRSKLDAARTQLEDGQQQLNAAKAELEDGQAQVDAAVAGLDDQQAQLDAAVAQANQDGTYASFEAQFDAQQAAIDAARQELAEQQATLDSGFATLEQKQAVIDANWAKLDDTQERLDAGSATLAAKQRDLAAGRTQLKAGQADLDAGKAKLVSGQRKLAAGKAEMMKRQLEVTNGLATIAEKQREIDAGWATVNENQPKLDAAPAMIAANEQKLRVGQTLLDHSSGIRMVSTDGSTAVAAVQFSSNGLYAPAEVKDAVKAAFLATVVPGVAVDLSSSIASAMPSVIGPREAAGVLFAAIVLFVVLGTLVGASLPIVTALLGVGVGALTTLSFASVVEMTSVTPMLGVMLGLAVGIDYALFIVNRHRRQLRDGYTVEQSIALANGTSGNAVLFAGTTVIIALLALNVTGIPFLGLMGSVGALGVAIAVLMALTLTPALLSLVGTRILRPREQAAAAAQAGPAPVRPAKPTPWPVALARVVAGVAVLAVVALPAGSLRLGLPMGSADAEDSTQHQAYDIMADKFGAGINGPLVVVADLPGSPTEDELLAAQARLATGIASFPDVVAVAPLGASPDRTVTAFQVVPAEGPSSVSTERLVSDLRAASPMDGVTIGVAGATSGNIDISAKLSAALPLYLALVVGLSVLIMVVVFRSLFVPLVATTGFVLSFLGALGGVVAIYQWGWLGSLFGVASPEPVLNFLPTILVGVLFGLAMDYMLFLASGMREAYAHGAPAKTAVVLGVRAGRRVVVAAAIIMISVFGGFMFNESAMVRPIGFALAFGVLVDAFVVRLLIVPAAMSLAGDRAWWLPRWLDRIIPNVDVEGASLERRHPHVAIGHVDAT